MRDSRDAVRRPFGASRRTYAQQGGIRLRDRPGPIFQLLVLALLAGKPVAADVAARAARHLFRAGFRSPRAVLDGDRDRAVLALHRAGYAREDDGSASRLRDVARRVRDEFDGDLRNLRTRSGQDPNRLADEVMTFDGVGRRGAQVFLREIQAVWPWVRDRTHESVSAGMSEHGPSDVEERPPRTDR